MDIKHYSRRLLLLGAPASGLLDLTHALTGSSPSPDASTGSCAGLTHEWEVRTPYYTATVPVWIDEISKLEEWKEQFMKPEASEVVTAVGAWVYVFRLRKDGGFDKEVEKTMEALNEVLEAHDGAEYGEEKVLLAVGMPASGGGGGVFLRSERRAEWEDVAMGLGWEFVEFGQKGKNEFGEKQGVERVREALEAGEWEESGDGLAGEDGDGEEDEFGDFGREEAEMTAELFGLKASLLGEEDEDGEGEGYGNEKDQVDDLDKMMSKLMAVREQSADLPEAQRKRMAAKAVRELMGDGAGL
jgi:hypothetical protein